VTTAPVQIGETLAGKYRIERVIGAGGMGVVVAATHLGLGQRVAIKFLLPSAGADHDTLARFDREARALAKLESEHVARVMDVGSLGDGMPYMVMEYLDGQDLAAVIRARGPIDVTEAVGWVLEACDAVTDAHAAGIIHRDLKPANIFLASRKSGRSVVKVLDFGISKSRGAETGELALTRTATVLGSPLYMSPEQIHESRDVDPRSDVWALGVILYELTTGTPPFNAESLPSLIAKILSETPVSPHARRAEVPEDFSRVVMRCLEKERSARWATVAELAASLEPFVRASPSSASPKEPAPSALASSIEAPVASAPTAAHAQAPAPESSSPSRGGERRSLVFLGVGLLVAVVGGTTLLVMGASSDSPTSSADAAAPSTSSASSMASASSAPSAAVASPSAPPSAPPAEAGPEIVAVPSSAVRRPVPVTIRPASPTEPDARAPAEPASAKPREPERPSPAISGPPRPGLK